nr:phosphatidylinositol-glycan biosynthesis class X protein-like [Ipomoea batatas]GME01690.1 phosphatidylinositol-glycan biosynthesis class X protein-like [Ipomoea batatas]GME08037.1 phosphatidylinositol-glycan biosynthesis class X protein-like [Ipomoea batatas]
MRSGEGETVTHWICRMRSMACVYSPQELVVRSSLFLVLVALFMAVHNQIKEENLVLCSQFSLKLVYLETILELPSFRSNQSLNEVHLEISSKLFSSHKDDVEFKIELPLQARYQLKPACGYLETGGGERGSDVGVEEGECTVVATGMKGGGEASHSKLGMIEEGLLESMEENIYDKNLEITL